MLERTQDWHDAAGCFFVRATTIFTFRLLSEQAGIELPEGMIQESGDIARMMAIFGDLDGSGPTSVTGVAPELPDPALLVSSPMNR